MFDLSLEIDVNEFGQDITSSARVLNQMAREALGQEIEEHFEKRIPSHFDQGAHAKYGYAQRSRKYIGKKIQQFKTGRDLVRTGVGREAVTRETRANHVTYRGAAFGEGAQGLQGRMQLRWPHPQNRQEGQRKDGMPKVTAQQMSRELTALTPEEKQQIADGFGHRMGRLFTLRKYVGRRMKFGSART